MASHLPPHPRTARANILLSLSRSSPPCFVPLSSHRDSRPTGSGPYFHNLLNLNHICYVQTQTLWRLGTSTCWCTHKDSASMAAGQREWSLLMGSHETKGSQRTTEPLSCRGQKSQSTNGPGVSTRRTGFWAPHPELLSLLHFKLHGHRRPVSAVHIFRDRRQTGTGKRPQGTKEEVLH